MMDAFKAFAAAQSLSLGDLTVESDEDQVAIYGRLGLTIDQGSLATLDRLITVLTQARADLAQAMGEGRASAPPPKDLPSVPNPFV
jgi:hypothetical protein